MATQSSFSAPDPGSIFEELQAYQRSAALKGALDLEIFTHIDDGAATTPEIARRAGASERGVRILCDFLTVRGLLTKNDNAYGLSQNARLFLSKRSPAYLGAMANFLSQSQNQFTDVAAAVRKGGTVQAETALEPDHPIWVEFARSMAGLASMIAQDAAGVLRQQLAAAPPAKVLDIAAGHGMYGIAIGKVFPGAVIVGQDWGNVLAVARENAREAGLAERYQTIPGSAFDVDFGPDYDLVLVPNFAHHFDVPTNATLFKKIRAALKPGGRIAIIEFIPDEDRVSPPMAAAFALTMLNATPGGDAYTFAQYQRMLDEAGFSGAALHQFPRAPQRMVMARCAP